MKDTAVLGDLGRNILGKVVGKLVVFPRFFRALGSVPSMFPRGRTFLRVTWSTSISVGGVKVWQECSGIEATSKQMLTFPKNRYKDFANKLRKLREKCEEEVDYKDGFDSILEELYANPNLVEEIMTHNHTADEFYTVLKTMAPRYMKLVDKYYHLDGSRSTKTNVNEKKPWKTDSRYWTDPLSTPLPNVTNLKIYCSKTAISCFTVKSI